MVERKARDLGNTVRTPPVLVPFFTDDAGKIRFVEKYVIYA